MSRRSLRPTCGLIVFALSLLLTNGSAHAVPRDWNRSIGGAYFNANHWTPNGVPVAGDDISFLLTVSSQEDITLLHDRTAADLLVQGGDVRFAGIGINTFNLDSATIEVPAKLTLQGLTRGYLMNIGGELDVKGGLAVLDGTQLTSGGSTIDGINNPSVRLAGSNSSGATSSWNAEHINIGYDDSGDLRLEDGATVRTDSLRLGAGAVSISGNSLSGAPTTVAVEDFAQFGDRLGNNLDILQGGLLTTPGVRVGSAFATEVKLDGRGTFGDGSRWDISGPLFFSRGNFVVSGGGVLNSGDSSLAGSLVVTDPGSTWVTTGVLRASGVESLAVRNGARVASEEVVIGNFNNAGVAVDGGVWTNSANAYVGGSQSAGTPATGDIVVRNGRAQFGGKLVIWQNGTVDLGESGLLIADRIENTSGGSFDFTAGELQANRFDGSLVNQAGRLAPGGSNAGATIIIGDYEQFSGATLRLGIGGISPSASYDVVTVSGDANLDGQLQLSLIDGFVPTATDTFTVFTSDSLVGFFDNVATGQRLASSDGVGSFVVNYGVGSAFDETRIVLSEFLPTVSLPGDYNDDGVVDAADYSVWRDNLGAPAGTLVNDVDGGVIGSAQYNTWRSSYGSVATPVSLSITKMANVPEPTAVSLLLSLVTLARLRYNR